MAANKVMPLPAPVQLLVIRDGLAADFSVANFNLCTKSTNRDGQSLLKWREWKDLPGFPNTSEIDRLVFLNNYVRDQLAAQKHLRRNYTRPDMNVYRGWVMNRILKQLLSRPDWGDNYRLPEDMPKVVEDLNIHRIHNAKMPAAQRNFSSFATFEDLRDAVTPWRPKNPISDNERDAAHKMFLAEEGGNGEAVRLATLENGTEIIHVKTEAASIAYGSPRWCTAYRNQPTYFEEYKKDLLIVLAANGSRWQLHFGKLEFRDADDDTYALDTLLKEQPGLAGALEPYARAKFNQLRRDPDKYNLEYLMKFCGNESWSGWLGDRTVARALKADNPAAEFWGVVSQCHRIPRWRTLVKTDVIKNRLAKLRDDDKCDVVFRALRLCRDDPEWKKLKPVGCAFDYMKKAILGNSMWAKEIFGMVAKDDEWSAEIGSAAKLNEILTLCRNSKLTLHAPEALIEEASKKPIWRAVLAGKDGLPAYLTSFLAEDSKRSENFHLQKIMTEIPEWRQAIIEAGVLPRLLIRAAELGSSINCCAVFDVCRSHPDLVAHMKDSGAVETAYQLGEHNVRNMIKHDTRHWNVQLDAAEKPKTSKGVNPQPEARP
jgi:hypothetical protein